MTATKKKISIEARADEWLDSGNVGASSRCIYQFMRFGGVESCHYPHDAADFGRCLELLKQVPEWETRLGEMAELPGHNGKIWEMIAVNYFELKEIYLQDQGTFNEFYWKLLHPIEKKSGNVFNLEGGKVSMGVSFKTENIGHNAATESAQEVGGVAGERLRSFIERVERLDEEKAAIGEDIKEVFSEAKAVGFDVKTMRKIIKLRKMDTEKRREEDELLDLYMAAIGMQRSFNF
jgi:uncharacterized protein (UPF0335 family)